MKKKNPNYAYGMTEGSSIEHWIFRKYLYFSCFAFVSVAFTTSLITFNYYSCYYYCCCWGGGCSLTIILPPFHCYCPILLFPVPLAFVLFSPLQTCSLMSLLETSFLMSFLLKGNDV